MLMHQVTSVSHRPSEYTQRIESRSCSFLYSIMSGSEYVYELPVETLWDANPILQDAESEVGETALTQPDDDTGIEQLQGLKDHTHGFRNLSATRLIF